MGFLSLESGVTSPRKLEENFLRELGERNEPVVSGPNFLCRLATGSLPGDPIELGDVSTGGVFAPGTADIDLLKCRSRSMEGELSAATVVAAGATGSSAKGSDKP